jgi:hypothetical protein
VAATKNLVLERVSAITDNKLVCIDLGMTLRISQSALFPRSIAGTPRPSSRATGLYPMPICYGMNPEMIFVRNGGNG